MAKEYLIYENEMGWLAPIEAPNTDGWDATDRINFEEANGLSGRPTVWLSEALLAATDLRAGVIVDEAPPRLEQSIEAARDRVRQQLRVEREGMWGESDKHRMMALDLGTDEQVAAIKTHRQKLRDIPVNPKIANETNVDTLFSYDIAALIGEHPTVAQ